MIFLRKRLIIISSIIILFVCMAAGATAIVTAYLPKSEITIIIDAGHGGVDAGVLGVQSKTKESDINLSITKKLKKELENLNCNIVLTREDENGLYGETTKNFKREDMKKRKEIILNSEPTLVVSIHCNKFPQSSRRGAQVFFNKFSEKGISLAKIIQTNINTLNKKYNGREFSALKGDYYILNCSPYPSIIIECGFLSNPEDDKLLNSNEYQQEIAKQVAVGIEAYILNLK